MATMPRTSGIDVVGAMPWGTHFCHFYETKADLLDTLVPYFKAGLDSGEFCVWIVSEPLTEADAWAALGRAVPDLDRHFADCSIEIIPAAEWYLRSGTLAPRARPRAGTTSSHGPARRSPLRSRSSSGLRTSKARPTLSRAR